MKLLGALFITFSMLVPSLALAQIANNQPIYQSGSVTPGHLGMFATSGVLMDAGAANGGPPGTNPNSLNITGPNNPFCINDAPVTSLTGYHQLCLGFGSNPASQFEFSMNSYAGAADLPCTFIVNGTNFPCIGNINGTPFVASTSALSTLQSTFSAAVIRLDYATGNGAPPLLYLSTSSPCSLNSGAGDGGLQVPTSDSKCWVAQFTGNADVREWGATSTSDASIIIQTALNDSPVPVSMPSPQSAQFTISSNVSVPSTANLVCSPSIPGYPPSYNFTGNANIFLSSSASIIFGSTAGGKSGIHGCNIVRNGFVNPTDLRSMITQVQSFAGTALTCTNASGSDVTIERNILIGFAQGITNFCTRTHIVQNYGDDTAGVFVGECLDICEIHDDEWFPFLASSQSGLTTSETLSVSSATNSGGNIELAYTPGTTPLVTGDTVVISNVGGVVSGARCVITVNDSSHITLTPNGAICPSFSGSYTSGGTILLSAIYRTGASFTVSNSGATSGGPKMARMSEYGFDIGLHYGGIASFVDCTQCWLDNTVANNNDPVPVGLLMDGSSGGVTASFGGYIHEPSQSVVMTNNGGRLYLSDAHIDSLGWHFGAHGVDVEKGSLYMNQTDVDAVSISNEALYIADGASKVYRNSGLFNGATVFQTSSTDCVKYFVSGWTNCAWTPAFTASGGGAPSGYTTQVGNYALSLAGNWRVSGDIIATDKGTLTGAIEILMPISQASGGSVSDQAICTVNRVGVISALSGGATWVSGQVTGNSNVLILSQLPNTANLTNTNFSLGTMEVEFGCTGHNP